MSGEKITLRAPIAPDPAGKGLRFLYGTALGRLLLRPLISRPLSRLAGAFLDSRASKIFIKPFVRSAGFDLADYITDGFSCFNDCFTRRIRDGLRPIEEDPDALVSPCDGLISAYRIGDDTSASVIPAKQSKYTIDSLLGDAADASAFAGGTAIVFRLCVDHYHRYAFFDGGVKHPGVFIPGKLHTVRPIALEVTPVFTQNCREVTIIESDNFGYSAQIEIGAMLVGKIANHRTGESFRVERGEEKGMFLYGGSTIVLLLAKGAAITDEALFEATAAGLETPVRMGEKIGYKA